MSYNRDSLDALALTSFLLGVANYNENLTQEDKDDIMQRLDEQTTDILARIEIQLEKQNIMLDKIMEKLDERAED